MGNDRLKNPQQAPQEEQQIIPHKKFEKYRFVNNNEIQITTQVDQNQLNIWKNNLKKIKNFTDHDVLLLQTSHKEDRNGLCTSNYRLDINFENYPYVFYDQIANRIQNKKYLQESELWYLLFCLLVASKNFAALKSKIGDVRPYNIFINQQGQIKIANLYSWPYQKTNFQKTLYFNETTFLSPQQMKLIQNKAQNTTDRVKSQSFSIGLTMLNCLILYDATKLYNTSFNIFDFKRFEQKIQQMKSFQWIDETNTRCTYSRLLKSIVFSLCNPNPQIRTSSLDLYHILQPYEEQIMKLQPFNHNLVQFQYPPQFNTIQNIKPKEIINPNKQFNSNPPIQQSFKYPPPQQTSQTLNTNKQFINNPPIQQTFKYPPQQTSQVYYQQIPSVQPYQNIKTTTWNQPLQTNQTQYKVMPTQPFQQVTPQIQSQIYQSQKLFQVLPSTQQQYTIQSNYVPQQTTQYFTNYQKFKIQSQQPQIPPQFRTQNLQKPLDRYIPSQISPIKSNSFNYTMVQQSRGPQSNVISINKQVSKINGTSNSLNNFNFNPFATSVEKSIKISNAALIKTNQVTTNNSAIESDLLRKIDEQLQISRQKYQ